MKSWILVVAPCWLGACYIDGDLGDDGTLTTSSVSSSSGSSTSTGTGGAGGTGGSGSCVPGTTVACYTGATGTEGVGICKGGSRACTADGKGWGPCLGEVVPQPENCATPEDEDCDGKTPTCPDEPLLWAKGFGNFVAWPQNVMLDAAGNAVIVGWSEVGLIDFGGGSMAPATGLTLVVAKLDASGNYVWSKGFSFNVAGVFASQYLGAALDSAGNVLLTGGAPNGSIDFGGGTLTGMFVAKLDSTGHHLWSKQFAGGAGASVAVDAADSVLLTGGITSAIDFGDGDGPLMSTSAQGDLFVAKLDASGQPQWSRNCGQGSPAGKTIAVSGGGDVFVTGGLSSLVAKFDTSGTPVWSRSWGSTGGSVDVMGVALDAAGEVIITGQLAGSVDLGGGELTAPGMEKDTFVAKLDAAGGHVWSKRFGAMGLIHGAGPSVAVDGGGNVWLTGNLYGTADFGGGSLTSAGDADVFLTKLSGDGGYLGGKIFGDARAQAGHHLVTDSAGNAIVVGDFRGSIDFGAGPLTAYTDDDNIFVAKFGP